MNRITSKGSPEFNSRAAKFQGKGSSSQLSREKLTHVASTTLRLKHSNKPAEEPVSFRVSTLPKDFKALFSSAGTALSQNIQPNEEEQVKETAPAQKSREEQVKDFVQKLLQEMDSPNSKLPGQFFDAFPLLKKSDQKRIREEIKRLHKAKPPQIPEGKYNLLKEKLHPNYSTSFSGSTSTGSPTRSPSAGAVEVRNRRNSGVGSLRGTERTIQPTVAFSAITLTQFMETAEAKFNPKDKKFISAMALYLAGKEVEAVTFLRTPQLVFPMESTKAGQRIIKNSNRLADFVTLSIVSAKDIEHASQYINFWIQVMQRLDTLTIKGFKTDRVGFHQSWMDLNGALASGPVSRIKPAWELLPENQKVYFDAVQAHFIKQGTIINFQQKLIERSLSPYLGRLNANLVFIMDGNEALEDQVELIAHSIIGPAKAVGRLSRASGKIPSMQGRLSMPNFSPEKKKEAKKEEGSSSSEDKETGPTADEKKRDFFFALSVLLHEGAYQVG